MSKISELSDGGALQSTDYLIAVRSGGNVKVRPNGTVTGTTGSFSGNVTFADNAKAIFGAGSDLQIYHDGSKSYITDAGTGNLEIQGTDIRLLDNTSGGLRYLVASNNGGNPNVSLFYNNGKVFETTATGIDVTGSVEADGASVSGDAYFGANMYVQSVDGTNAFYVTRYGTVTTESAKFTLDDNDLIINSIQDEQYGGYTFKATHNGVGTANRLDIANNGDISFYEDTGTTPKFFWDASAEKLALTGDGTGLSVVGATQTIAGGNSNVKIGSSDTAAADKGGQLNFTANTTSSANYPVAGIHGYHETLGAGNYSGYLSLFTTSSGGAITERMRIDSSGNVGIGTTSPARPLTVNGLIGSRNSTTGFGTSDGFDIGVGGSDAYLVQRENANIIIETNGAERMRITSAGNVGIGVSSPEKRVHIFDSTQTNQSIRFGNPSATPYGEINFNSTGAEHLYIRSQGTTTGYGNIVFETGGSLNEAMRLDASGNLLVGKTSSNPNIQGVQAYSSGLLAISKDSGRPLYINRNTTDGELIDFVKDGTAVGSIGTKDGDIYIGTDDTNLRFVDGSDKIYPSNGSGNARDNAIDLGNDNARFKDLYLSGGVYLGGTGAANLLDDYEEGTWTSSTTSNNLTTYGAFTGRYTKVGNIVHLSGELAGISAGTGNRFFEFTAPFNQYAAINISIGVCNNYPRGNRRSGQVINASSGNTTEFYVTWNNDSSQSSDRVRFQITYETT